MPSDAAVEGISGAAGAVLSLFSTYPLMRVSTLQATRREAKGKSAYALLSQILKEEGLDGVFRGIGPAVVGTAISQGVYFYLYSALKDLVASKVKRTDDSGSHDANLGVLLSTLVAVAAGCGNVLLTNPVWLIVTKMQASTPKARKGPSVQLRPLPGAADKASSDASPSKSSSASKGASSSSRPATIYEEGAQRPQGRSKADKVSVMQCILEVYKDYGIKGYWNGVVPSLVMVCNPTVQYVVYEVLVARLRAKKRKQSGGSGPVTLTAVEVFGLSALAKLAATLVTYPLLVLKSRLQAQSKDKGQHYKSTWHAVIKIWEEEKLGGFFKGLKTKVVQSVFAAALMFSLKEKIYRTTKALIAA